MPLEQKLGFLNRFKSALASSCAAYSLAVSLALGTAFYGCGKGDEPGEGNQQNGNQRYACQMNECVPDSNGPYSVADCDNTCGDGTSLERKIVYASARAGNSEIYVMNADGSDQIKLTDTLGSIKDETPAWSPNGTKIAFASTRDWSGFEIYIMNTDGSNPRNVTNTKNIEEVSPSWSPDGTKIVFHALENFNSYIDVMNADGSNRKRLTDTYTDWDPCWSPDGTKIAFTSHRDGDNNSQIYVMNADGSDQRRLTYTLAGENDEADWSPDGRQIAFTNEDKEENNEIYVMNADGSNVRRLTDSPQGDHRPAWSPDGTQIIFDSYRDGNDELYIMNADSSNQRNLTKSTDVSERAPDWR